MSKEVIERLNNGDLPVDFNWDNDSHPKSTIPRTIRPRPTPKQAQKVEIVAEDLRDGLHGVSIYPSVEEMIDYVGVLNDFGISTITVGIYPGKENGENKINVAIKRLLSQMRNQYPAVTPIVLSLTTESSINWTADCKQINPKLQALIFMGSAPVRLLVEQWAQDFVLKQLGWAINEAVFNHEIEVIGGTEHTTQTPPEFLRKIVKTQVENGAKYFCIADTIGTITPIGTYRIIKYVKNILKEIKTEHIPIDWHGHNDLGNAATNALTAIAAGANRVHTVARGTGERAGNTPLEVVLLNLSVILEEANLKNPWQMKQLSKVLDLYSQITKTPAPTHGPLSERSHKTSLGIHSSAIFESLKLTEEAKQLGYLELAKKLEKMSRQVYTAVDPYLVGKEHQIFVGPWSGKKTVQLAYSLMGGNLDLLSEDVINHILLTAKKIGRELTEKELIKLFKTAASSPCQPSFHSL